MLLSILSEQFALPHSMIWCVGNPTLGPVPSHNTGWSPCPKSRARTSSTFHKGLVSGP